MPRVGPRNLVGAWGAYIPLLLQPGCRLRVVVGDLRVAVAMLATDAARVARREPAAPVFGRRRRRAHAGVGG